MGSTGDMGSAGDPGPEVCVNNAMFQNNYYYMCLSAGSKRYKRNDR